MKIKIAFVFVSLMLMSCSSTDKSSSGGRAIHSSFQNQTRIPSNDENIMELQSTEEFVKWVADSVNKNNIEPLREAFHKLIEIRVELFALAEKEMIAYDKLLDAKYQIVLAKLNKGEVIDDTYNFDISALKDDQYLKLRTVWQSTEETRFKLFSIYTQLLDLAFNLDYYKKSIVLNNVEARKKAVETLKWFQVDILGQFATTVDNESDKIRKLALQDIFEMFLEIQSEFNDNIKQTINNTQDALYVEADYVSGSARNVFNTLQNDLIKNVLIPEELFKLYRENKSRILVGLTTVKKELLDQVKRRVEESKKLWNEFKMYRSPQASPKCYYRPSTDTCGDMMGFAYDKGTWVLTFDDGPHPTRTIDIINFLSARNINAIFFTMGKNFVSLKKSDRATFDKYLELFKRTGMVLGNHSMSHPQMSKLAGNPSQLKYEITDVSKLYSESDNFGYMAEYMRLPYGDGTKNPAIREVIKQGGMIHMFWNVDTLDWQDKNPDSILDRAWKQMVVNQRGIVLFHDIHPQSIAASKMLVQRVLNEGDNKNTYGFKFKPIKEVKDELNKRVPVPTN